MTYFHEVEDYQTYKGAVADFHFDYNANSGGGQAFFGGSFYDGHGGEAQPSSLQDYSVSFSVRYPGADFMPVTVALGADGLASYRFVPRGSGSAQMKLQIDAGDGAKRIAPSLLLAAFFMLPPTCGVNMASSLDESPLTRENYWLRSMWLNCEVGDDETAVFIPTDFVFSGGASKRRGVSPTEGQVTGEPRFFKLDYVSRIKDVIAAAAHPELFTDGVAACLRHFADVYSNTKPFSYQECADTTKKLMSLLASDYPDGYSGISDPLPFITDKVTAAPRFTAASINEPRNLIYFGAPGTGKSHDLNELAKAHYDDGHTRRVTFHPDYSYASFVGCYKPTMVEEKTLTPKEPVGEEAAAEGSEPEAKQEEKHTRISYQFVPGPLVASYVDAKTHPDENFVLVIEEINRANPAAVFGDVFQLLDRDEDGKSEYPVSVSDDLGAYLFKEFMHRSGISYNRGDEVPGLYTVEEARRWRVSSMALPPNLYLWATMNSADQGVFPIDTAFKRRWEFRYMGIDAGEDIIADKVVHLGADRVPVCWNDLRKAVNALLVKVGVNEDKLMGPFFLRPSALDDDAVFSETFKSKVLLYLFEDAAKMRRDKVFSDKAGATYSEICAKFDELGDGVFAMEPVKRADEDVAEGSDEGAEA